jgi:hypothetical protein
MCDDDYYGCNNNITKIRIIRDNNYDGCNNRFDNEKKISNIEEKLNKLENTVDKLNTKIKKNDKLIYQLLLYHKKIYKKSIPSLYSFIISHHLNKK